MAIGIHQKRQKHELAYFTWSSSFLSLEKDVLILLFLLGVSASFFDR